MAAFGWPPKLWATDRLCSLHHIYCLWQTNIFLGDVSLNVSIRITEGNVCSFLPNARNRYEYADS